MAAQAFVFSKIAEETPLPYCTMSTTNILHSTVLCMRGRKEGSPFWYEVGGGDTENQKEKNLLSHRSVITVSKVPSM